MASGSSRPHRLARSGVSYRDPQFNYEEDFAPCRRLGGAATSKKRSKKTVTMSSLASISKERENAKERAEALQLQRAIDESLLDKATKAAVHMRKCSYEDTLNTAAHSISSSFNNKDVEKDVTISLFDLKEVIEDRAGYKFQCLLDVAREAVLEGDIPVCRLQEASVDVQISKNQMFKFSMDRHQSDEKVTVHEAKVEHNPCKEDSSVYVNPMDQEDGDSKQAVTDDETSDLSSELGCKRVKPMKVEQEARSKNTTLQIASSVRPALMSRVETLSAASCKTSLLQLDKSLAQQVKATWAGKENIPTCPFTPSTESKQSRDWQVTFSKPQVAAENNTALRSCQSVQNIREPWKASKSQSFTSVSPSQEDFMNLPSDLSTSFHRRVIGLSRCFRPPPLHPYLSRQDR